MTNVEMIRLQKWWQGEIRELTRKEIAKEEKRQEKERKKAETMFSDLAIERREDIDDLYAYGTISERKRDKLIDVWETSQGHGEFYKEKIALLQDAYAESLKVVQDLERMEG